MVQRRLEVFKELTFDSKVSKISSLHLVTEFSLESRSLLKYSDILFNLYNIFVTVFITTHILILQYSNV
jgi:hypothetical protein